MKDHKRQDVETDALRIAALGRGADDFRRGWNAGMSAGSADPQHVECPYPPSTIKRAAFLAAVTFFREINL